MDIGFGALIEKFEEYLGKRLTHLLIVVIFVAVFALCAKAIADNLIEPILKFFRTPVWETTLIEIAFLAGAVAAGVTGGIYAMASFAQWQATKQSLKNLRRTKELRNGMRSIAGEVDEIMDSSSSMLDDVSKLNTNSVDLMDVLLPLVRAQFENSDHLWTMKEPRPKNEFLKQRKN